jgi:hypothetical protein
MTDSSLTHSTFEQQANSDSVRSAPHLTDLELTAPAMMDLEPVDLRSTDWELTGLAQIDLRNLAPSHSAPPAPVACHSHRQVCQRLADSEPL